MNFAEYLELEWPGSLINQISRGIVSSNLEFLRFLYLFLVIFVSFCLILVITFLGFGLLLHCMKK